MTERRRFRWFGANPELSSPQLLRECGRKLTNPDLWQEFEKRFKRPIITYVVRALNQRGTARVGSADLVNDLAQEVFLRLIEHNGRLLCSFKGESDFQVLAFLSTVSVSVVADHYRRAEAGKRRTSQFVSMEATPKVEEVPSGSSDFNVTAILSWIDVQRLMDMNSDRKHAARDVLIFKLFYIDGLTSQEIAQFPGFGLTESGIENVLRRLRERLQKGMG